MITGKKKPELLIPASSLEVLKVAILYGADAVYIGGEMYGLRAKAKNFSREDMAEGIKFAHAHGKKWQNISESFPAWMWQKMEHRCVRMR